MSGRNLSQRQITSTTLQVDPRLIVSSQIMALNSIELESAVETELAENPALERLSEPVEPLTDDQILGKVAPSELKPASEDFEFLKTLPQGPAEEVDWLDFAGSTDSLSDHLLAQLSSMLPPELRVGAEFAVGSIDHRGYFTSTPEELALACGLSLEAAEEVVVALRACEPAGIGAFNLQDCLELQLREGTSLEERLAHRIVRDHLTDFLDGNARGLMRRYRVLPAVVEEAFRLIRSLNPYPGEAFARTEGPSPARPDLKISRSEAGWTVEVDGIAETDLIISRAYSTRLNGPKLDRDERRHLTSYVNRAKTFIGAVRQRRETLSKVGWYLLGRQEAFLSTGKFEFLNSLTRSEIAQSLGLHESTVSRALAGKFVQIPTGEVLSFEVFFKPAMRVQKVIEEILSYENPRNPLSDERIAEMLAERGIHVARRTVNKYRDRTKLLSSRRRKSA